MPKSRRSEFLLLARVRRSLRSLNNAITRGAAQAGLTLQQQAFLLAITAYGERDVPFADVREELEMDRATASILLQKLIGMRLVSRSKAIDRRASRISLTTGGRRDFQASVELIRREIQAADHRDELGALRDDLERYLGFYLPRGRPRTTAVGRGKARVRRRR
jgi:DNA-binding MarR family transcriptional regulator